MHVRKVIPSSDHTRKPMVKLSESITPWAQMLTVLSNERRNDLDKEPPSHRVCLRQLDQSSNRSSPHQGTHRLPRFVPLVFGRPRFGGHQDLDRDQVEYCNLAVDRQRRAYALARECHALTVSRIQPRNTPPLSGALKLSPYSVGKWAWGPKTRLPHAHAQTAEERAKTPTIRSSRLSSPCFGRNLSRPLLRVLPPPPTHRMVARWDVICSAF